MPSPVLQIRLPPALLAALQEQAAAQGQTPSEVARKLLAGALGVQPDLCASGRPQKHPEVEQRVDDWSSTDDPFEV